MWEDKKFSFKLYQKVLGFQLKKLSDQVINYRQIFHSTKKLFKIFISTYFNAKRILGICKFNSQQNKYKIVKMKILNLNPMKKLISEKKINQLINALIKFHLLIQIRKHQIVQVLRLKINQNHSMKTILKKQKKKQYLMLGLILLTK